MRAFSTVALVCLLGCSEERTLEITRLPIACADDVRSHVTQVVIGAEGDFAAVLLSQPPDAPLELASLPQNARVLTIVGTIGGKPMLIGRTALVDLATAPPTLPIAYGPPGGFCATGSMHVPRTNHAAVRMQDGRVLVAGGGDPSIEIYDPRNASWDGYDTHYELGAASVIAVALEDGRVLLVGDGQAQFIDAEGHLVRPALFLGGVRNAVGVRLADGRVLVAGTQTSAIFDPTVGAFTSGPATLSRSGGAAFLLADGRVLLAGGGALAEVLDIRMGPGIPLGGTSGPVAWAQLASGTIVGFSDAGNGDIAILPEVEMQVLPLGSHSTAGRATVLGDDLVLLTGGLPALFVPSRGDTIAATNDPAATRAGASLTLLDDGTVLAAGGSTSEAKLYFHSTTNPFSTLPIMTFDADEQGLIPRAPGTGRAQRINGTYELVDNFALLGGVRFAAATIRVSFSGDLDILVGWQSMLETFTVRFRPGANVVLLHDQMPLCSGGPSPEGGFVTVFAREGRIRATDGSGAGLLDCAAALPPRFAVGIGGQRATVDDLDVSR